MSKKNTKTSIEKTLVKEMGMSSSQDTSLSRSDARRAVEDLLELKRYKTLHEDYLDF